MIELEFSEKVLRSAIHVASGVRFSDEIMVKITAELEKRDHCCVHEDNIDGG